jgi:excisionase family DNA binding protein
MAPGRSNKQHRATSDPYITIDQTAAYLGVTSMSIRNMIHDGRLKAYQLGPRVVRLRLSEIDAALQPYGSAV